MSNTTTKRGHRPRKDAKRITANISNAAVTDRCESQTLGIESALTLLEFVSDAAAAGDDRAISLLAAIGLEVKTAELEPTIVKRKDGSVAAWIF